MRKLATITAAMLMACCMCVGFTQADAQPVKDTAFKVSPNDITNQAAIERMDHERAKLHAAQAIDSWQRMIASENEAENTPESDSEPIWDGVLYEDDYAPVYADYGAYSGSGSTATTLGELLNGQGRAYGEDGTAYTWYYHDLGYGALDIPGETFDEDGVIHDGDGYIVVATDAYEKGTVIDTDYGQARVYDHGCGSTIDIYTNR